MKKKLWIENIIVTGTEWGSQLIFIACKNDPNIIPAFLKQHQGCLGLNEKVNDLTNDLDALKIPPDKSEYIGCLLTWDRPGALNISFHVIFLRILDGLNVFAISSLIRIWRSVRFPRVRAACRDQTST